MNSSFPAKSSGRRTNAQSHGLLALGNSIPFHKVWCRSELGRPVRVAYLPRALALRSRTRGALPMLRQRDTFRRLRSNYTPLPLGRQCGGSYAPVGPMNSLYFIAIPSSLRARMGGSVIT